MLSWRTSAIAMNLSLARASIRTRLILAFLTVAGLPLLLAGTWSLGFVQRLIVQLQVEAVSETARLLDQGLADLGSRLEQELLAMGRDRSLVAFNAALQSGDRDQATLALAAFETTIVAAHLNRRGIHQVRYIDAGGREWLRIQTRDSRVEHGSVDGLADETTKAYHRAVGHLSQAGLFIVPRQDGSSLPQVDPSGRPLIHCAMPVGANKQPVQGRLIVELLPEALLDPLRPLFAGFRGTVHLVDETGLEVGWIGTSHGHDRGPALRMVLEAVGRSGPNDVVSFGDLVYLPRIYGLPQVWAATGWSILFSYPRDTVLGPASDLRGTYWLALGTALGLVLVAGLWVTRQLVAPILSMKDQATAVAGGDYSGRVAVSSGDEIEELARTFNRMAASLQEKGDQIKRTTDGLEALVRERTDRWQQAQAQLQGAERLASLGLLAGGAAHEINNPMGTILTTAQFMLSTAEEDGVPKGAIANLRKIVRQGERVARIVSDLLLFSQQTRLDRRPTSVASLLEEALHSIEHRVGASGDSIVRDLEADLPRVHVDALRMQLVVVNLLVNALDASQGGSKISVAARRFEREGQGLWVELCVTDSGIGIPAEVIGRIFDPFFTTKPPGKGTGLGLSISYGIVRDHGGEMRVTSQPGQGSRFAVLLPAAPLRGE